LRLIIYVGEEALIILHAKGVKISKIKQFEENLLLLWQFVIWRTSFCVWFWVIKLGKHSGRDSRIKRKDQLKSGHLETIKLEMAQSKMNSEKWIEF
jgi:hypothetical protein